MIRTICYFYGVQGAGLIQNYLLECLESIRPHSLYPFTNNKGLDKDLSHYIFGNIAIVLMGWVMVCLRNKLIFVEVHQCMFWL